MAVYGIFKPPTLLVWSCFVFLHYITFMFGLVFNFVYHTCLELFCIFNLPALHFCSYLFIWTVFPTCLVLVSLSELPVPFLSEVVFYFDDVNTERLVFWCSLPAILVFFYISALPTPYVSSFVVDCMSCLVLYFRNPYPLCLVLSVIFQKNISGLPWYFRNTLPLETVYSTRFVLEL